MDKMQFYKFIMSKVLNAEYRKESPILTIGDNHY